MGKKARPRQGGNASIPKVQDILGQSSCCMTSLKQCPPVNWLIPKNKGGTEIHKGGTICFYILKRIFRQIKAIYMRRKCQIILAFPGWTFKIFQTKIWKIKDQDWWEEIFWRLPVIKRLEPDSNRSVKSSTKTFPDGVTTYNKLFLRIFTSGRQKRKKRNTYLNTWKFYVICLTDIISSTRILTHRSITST